MSGSRFFFLNRDRVRSFLIEIGGWRDGPAVKALPHKCESLSPVAVASTQGEKMDRRILGSLASPPHKISEFQVQLETLSPKQDRE